MTNLVYLNGEFLPKSQAKISVLDRGFLFADGIYEVIPAYKKQLFRFEQHMTRLEDCLAQVNIVNPHSREQWHSLLTQVLNKNPDENASVYIQITRGAEQTRDHLSQATVPTIFIMVSPLNTDLVLLKPIKVLLTEDIRWQHCDIKSIALLANILLRQQAQASQCQEAILHRDNFITEGASSNIFVVKDNAIYTPAKSKFILGGITRDVIIELATAAAIEVHECDVSLEDLFSADEVWISSSTREISPVTQINDKIVNTGTVGAITTLIHSAFQEFKQRLTG